MTIGAPRRNAFGVYIHWPFCMAKCPYCDFNSHVRHKPVDQDTFVTGYEREIAHMAAMAPGREVTSIFFGGGTPSLMEPATLERILTAIDKHWHISNDVEISLEANPTSVEAGRFKAYRAAGVNRVSLGIQSLRDDQLKFLGRMHTAAEAKAAIELAREIFPRLSFDLIYARPEQTLAQWEKELREAIDLAADHLSLYQLTIEQGTPFYELHKRGRFQIPDQDLAADLYELTADITKAHNLAAYEISNYAAEGMECQHNLVYWRYQDYAGIGPGAHGRITTNEGKIATACERNPKNWWQKSNVDGHGMITQELLTLDEQADELLVMNLRLREGFDPAKYEALRKKPFDPKKIAMLKEFGFIESTTNGWIRATPSGFLLLDAVVADLAS
ncbi:MAG: coproporphyrinogen III oxidase [Rhizobiaceae bacterium]|nr:coproporphyrinogen III oxidase [Rhizobiaceae bacterium]